MKLIFKTNEVLEKLKNIAPTAEAKQTLAILGNVKVSVADNIATFTASDLEIQVTTTVSCVSTENGLFTAPAKKLLEICNALSAYDEISLYYDGKKVDITAGKSKVSLQTLDASDYPDMNIEEGSNSITIPNEELSKIITKTSFAMAYQDARHFLNGLHICSQDGMIVAVCTDGHRLAKYTSLIKSDLDISIIIPRKAINEINRIISTFSNNNEQIVEINVTNNMVIFTIGEYILISKLIEGTYPNFNKVIPEETQSKININKQTLKNSLNIISKVVNQQYKGVKLTPSPSSLHLISSNTESEVGEDVVDAIYDGDEISIGFNISYLQDVIDVIDGDMIDICINDQNSGCILLDENTNESTFVIMPMRV
jgi:DNA polymerase-3 subunit beta